jgi:serine/threonine-protein kinase SRPK3
MEWDYKVDIWNVGMVIRMIVHALSLEAFMKLIIAKIRDLFEHHHPFRARNPAHKLDDGYHLAEMQAVLGSPPPKFLVQSEKSLPF